MVRKAAPYGNAIQPAIQSAAGGMGETFGLSLANQ